MDLGAPAAKEASAYPEARPCALIATSFNGKSRGFPPAVAALLPPQLSLQRDHPADQAVQGAMEDEGGQGVAAGLALTTEVAVVSSTCLALHSPTVILGRAEIRAAVLALP